jgi:putative protease
VKTPELLAPAGSLKMARTALDFGATAIYAGQPRYSMRVRNNDFGKIENLAAGIALTHERGGKFYVVSNIVPHNAKLKTYLADMAPVIALQARCADHGRSGADADDSRNLAGDADPPVSAGQYGELCGGALLAKHGRFARDFVARIVHRRDCRNSPGMSLRWNSKSLSMARLCIAYSGRCLLSGYFNHRDPNQGSCTNSCRWDYKVLTSKNRWFGRYQPAASPANHNAHRQHD